MDNAVPSGGNTRKRGFIRLGRSILSHWQVYVLILPAFIYLAIFAYGPMYGVQMAFKDFKASLGIWASPYVGLKHFIRFVNYPDFVKLLKNTLSITLYSLSTFPLPIVFALALNEIRGAKFKKTVQMITYMPHFLSTVVMCSLIFMLTDKNYGPINNLLAFFGFDRNAFMSQPQYFSSIYVWSGVWQSLGWSAIIYIAALAGVSPELAEAARIDGAGRFQVIRHVNFPSILPTIIITFIMRTGSLLSLGFEKIFLLQNDLNLSASRVISTYTYEIGLIGGQFSYSTAIGLFNNIVNIIMLFIVNNIAKKVSDVGLW